MSAYNNYTGKPAYRWVNPHQTNYTPQERPYGYSAYYLIGDDKTRERCSVVYSDRLYQWDHDKAQRVRDKTNDKFGIDRYGNWRKWNLETASYYLSLYWEKPIKVTAIAEECHLGNGFPLWIIWYKDA